MFHLPTNLNEIDKIVEIYQKLSKTPIDILSIEEYDWLDWVDVNLFGHSN